MQQDDDKQQVMLGVVGIGWPCELVHVSVRLLGRQKAAHLQLRRRPRRQQRMSLQLLRSLRRLCRRLQGGGCEFSCPLRGVGQ